MGKPIIKLGDYYLEWSTIVDAPVTFGMSLEDFKEYYRWQYGEQGMSELDMRLKRVDAKGTSSFNDVDVDDTISWNRAGPDESCLSRDELYQAYCLVKPIRDGWLPR